MSKKTLYIIIAILLAVCIILSIMLIKSKNTNNAFNMFEPSNPYIGTWSVKYEQDNCLVRYKNAKIDRGIIEERIIISNEEVLHYFFLDGQFLGGRKGYLSGATIIIEQSYNIDNNEWEDLTTKSVQKIIMSSKDSFKLEIPNMDYAKDYVRVKNQDNNFDLTGNQKTIGNKNKLDICNENGDVILSNLDYISVYSSIESINGSKSGEPQLVISITDEALNKLNYCLTINKEMKVLYNGELIAAPIVSGKLTSTLITIPFYSTEICTKIINGLYSEI